MVFTQAACRCNFVDPVSSSRDHRPVSASYSPSSVGGPEEISQAKVESQGLGLFVRSLVGLDRAAAKSALAGFLDGKPLKANQIEFVGLVVDHLTDHGLMPAALLYESPFTDVSPAGPEGIFTDDQVEELVGILDGVRGTATAA